MTTEDKQKELDERYLRMAAIWAENSYCKRRQVGALIVKNKMRIMSQNLMFFTQRQMPLRKLHVQVIILMVQQCM